MDIDIENELIYHIGGKKYGHKKKYPSLFWRHQRERDKDSDEIPTKKDSSFCRAKSERA